MSPDPEDAMTRKEAERLLSEMRADPNRMSAKLFQEGYEASLRKSGVREEEIAPIVEKALRFNQQFLPVECDFHVALKQLEEALDDPTAFDTEDIHYIDAALHQLETVIRCLRAITET